MSRKEKKQHKRKILLFTIPLAIFALGALIVLLAAFFPRFTQIFQKSAVVQSAYITSPSGEQVVDLLRQKKISYSSIETINEGESYQITLERGTIVKISATRDVSIQIDTLHKLLRRLTIDNRQAREIDLRFTRPVVKY